MSLLPHRKLAIYLLYMAIATLAMIAFALFQHRFILGHPLSDLTPRMLVIPALLGLGFGYLVAAVLRLQHKQQTITEALLKHDRTLETELLERRRTEEQLHRQTQELRAANQELEAFGYAVSHDLRAPLRRITGFSEALSDACSNKDHQQVLSLLERIQRSIGHMHEMIDGLLGLSRITGVQLQRSPVNLSAMAHEIVDELTGSEPQRTVDVTIEPGLIVQADPHLLRHVLENLIGNAWKFTARETRPRIEIGAQQMNGSRIYYVRDNGVGFDPQYTDQMFLPFRRLHKDTDFEGNGIGLTTVQRIVQRHGGWIRAEGGIDQGSRFLFSLNGQHHPQPRAA